MKTKKFDAVLVWKQLEDLLVPRLALSVTDRAVYSHLLRHTRLEGKSRLQFSIAWLARGVRLARGPARNAVRRLAANGALRIIERSKAGHVVEVPLPGEIRGRFRRRAPGEELGRPTCGRRSMLGSQGSGSGPVSIPVSIEELDFLRHRRLRKAIHARERGKCFYCLRRIASRMKCLDHVRPRAQMGPNSYRNLVSSCMECNSRKGEMAAKDFLRWLYRAQRLSPNEFAARLQALDELAAGQLRPIIATSASSTSSRGRTLVDFA
jgi:5-methylcytosine-specific restriction endonuclease McrA